MKSVLLCSTFLLFGLVSRAQTNIASLNITLTDVQSVTFSSAALIEGAPEGKQQSQAAGLNLLSSSTSQIKKISSKNTEYEKLYKEFQSERAIARLSNSNANVFNAALIKASSERRPKSQNSLNLVIYQIDPR